MRVWRSALRQPLCLGNVQYAQCHCMKKTPLHRSFAVGIWVRVVTRDTGILCVGQALLGLHVRRRVGISTRNVQGGQKQDCCARLAMPFPRLSCSSGDALLHYGRECRELARWDKTGRPLTLLLVTPPFAYAMLQVMFVTVRYSMDAVVHDVDDHLGCQSTSPQGIEIFHGAQAVRGATGYFAMPAHVAGHPRPYAGHRCVRRVADPHRLQRRLPRRPPSRGLEVSARRAEAHAAGRFARVFGESCATSTL